jgi:hypothetical protein
MVDRIVALDDAGFAHGEPAEGQVTDVCLGFFAGGEAQRVAGPFAVLSAITSDLNDIERPRESRDGSSRRALSLDPTGSIRRGRTPALRVRSDAPCVFHGSSCSFPPPPARRRSRKSRDRTKCLVY